MGVVAQWSTERNFRIVLSAVRFPRTWCLSQFMATVCGKYSRTVAHPIEDQQSSLSNREYTYPGYCAVTGRATQVQFAAVLSSTPLPGYGTHPELSATIWYISVPS